jgi:hypothetical protein
MDTHAKERCACGAIGPPFNHFFDCGMRGLNFARVIVPGKAVPPPKTEVSPGPDEMTLDPAFRVVTQDEAHLFEKEVVLQVPIENPWPVYDSSGYRIGACNATWARRGLALAFVLSKQTPEAFDLDINPTNVRVRAELTTINGVLRGTVTLLGA